MNATIIKTENREQWLDKRVKGIGGTDISAILGVNKYKTPFDVWEDKTGRAAKFEGNKFTRRGIYMEDAVANYFEDVTGCKVIKASESEELLIHKKYPCLLGSPDRRYFDHDGQKGILECKTTMTTIDASVENIPQTWFIQVQWYLGLSGYTRGTIAWAELGFSSEFKHVEIVFNPEFFAYMVEQGVKFWEENVMTDKAPDAINSQDIEKIYPYSQEGKTMVVSDDFYNTYCELKALQDNKKALETEIDAKQEALKMALADAEIAKYGDNVLATWKTSKGSLKFDDKAFKTANPELWNQFAKEQPGSRRFLLK